MRSREENLPLSNVDPKRRRVILVVHGVQVETDEVLNHEVMIRQLMESRRVGPQIDYEVTAYRYENINDATRLRHEKAMGEFAHALLRRTKIDRLSDLVTDVLINLNDGTTAREIRSGLIAEILKFYRQGSPLYLVAHSLGTVYLFDALNELMADRRFFQRAKRRTWPVQRFITMGSPLGLNIFRRDRVFDLGSGFKFPWTNIWDRNDPVVSGSLFGFPVKVYGIVERFAGAKDLGWLIHDRSIDTAKAGIESHSGYWTHPQVGDALIEMVSS